MDPVLPRARELASLPSQQLLRATTLGIGYHVYSTMTRSLQTMADRLLDLGVTRVAMEATSDY